MIKCGDCENFEKPCNHVSFEEEAYGCSMFEPKYGFMEDDSEDGEE